MTFRIARLEFGALAVAGLAAVYAIWLAVGLPPLPLGTHVGRSPIAAPTVVQLANGPLRGTQPTFHPPVTTPGKPGRLDVGTALSTRFAPLPARKRTLPATPAAPAGPAPPRQTVDDSVHLALAPAASLSTPPPPPTPLPTTVTVPAVTVPALPQTPPVPSLPQVPQAPSPPPVTPPLPSVP